MSSQKKGKETLNGLHINRKLGKSNKKSANIAVAQCATYRGLPDEVTGRDWNKLMCLPPEEKWLHYKYPIENLVFSAGGLRALAYSGAAKALEEAGILHGIRRFAGCSAGSISASVLAVGSTAQELLDTMGQSGSYAKWLLQETKLPLFLLLPRLFSSKGLFPLKRFHRVLGEVIKRKVGNPDITFSQLYDFYGRELVIVVTNISTRKAEYLSRHFSPDLPIRDAVRMSISIPGVYQPFSIKQGDSHMTYVDGAMVNDYPLNVFDELKYEDGSSFEKKTLGFFLISETEDDRKTWRDRFGDLAPPMDKPTYAPATKLFREKLKEQKTLGKSEENLDSEHFVAPTTHVMKIKHIGDVVKATLATMSSNLTGHITKPDDYLRTVTINCGYYDGSVTECEYGDRRFLIEQGYESTKRYLQKYVHDTETKIETPVINDTNISVPLSTSEDHVTQCSLVDNGSQAVISSSASSRDHTQLANSKSCVELRDRSKRKAQTDGFTTTPTGSVDRTRMFAQHLDDVDYYTINKPNKRDDKVPRPTHRDMYSPFSASHCDIYNTNAQFGQRISSSRKPIIRQSIFRHFDDHYSGEFMVSLRASSLADTNFKVLLP